MKDDGPERDARAAELGILRALCTGLLAGVQRQQIFEQLADYSFADPLHQALFDTLRELTSERPDIIQQQLPARLTRKGFPEADFETLFTPPEQSPAQFAELVQRLRARGAR